jgi:2'-hydroxyisoflavone reductase
MHLARRQFLRLASASLAGITLAPSVMLAAAKALPPRPLRILILGGTGFLGPACTTAALARGHSVTHFNSGRTEAARKKSGIASVVPAGVEQLIGNRDPEKTADDRRTEGRSDSPKDPDSPKGLSQLAGRKWDAVIDTSGYFPRMVKASAEMLAPNVEQYLFVSTISVYRKTDQPNFDETAPILTLADPASEDFGANYQNYGGGKAMCELAAEKAMPGRVTSIRPGFIVGPRDTSGRFLYWPVRASLGGKMIVPGDPADPIQLIDVRDLGEWIVHCLENKVTGTFNATGPAKELSMKAMVDGVIRGVAAETRAVWVPREFLERQKVSEDRFPLYAPPTGETAGFHRCSISRALAKGLKFRPVGRTAKDTLDWYAGLAREVQARVAPQFAETPGSEPWLTVEKQVLAKWESSKSSQGGAS